MRPSSYVPWPVLKLRGGLRRINAYLSRHYERVEAEAHPVPETPRPARLTEAEDHLRQLEIEGGDADRAYFEKHLPRLARTMTLIPQSNGSGAILELGCYGQITPFLKDFCGYGAVRGAHFGPVGVTEEKVLSAKGQRTMIKVDLFDVERDLFPYPSESFETVLACELIEHMMHDPMHLLRECHRILIEGGRLLITTPNVGSLTSIARLLHGHDNPQIYSKYSLPKPGGREIPHVREYTAHELRDALRAAGFEIETLITETLEEFRKNLPIWNFLEDQGYSTALRGEQTYCVAIKRAALPVDRFPEFLYF